MKKDLEEIKETIQKESVTYINTTASAVTSTASYIKDTVADTVAQLALEEEEAEASASKEQASTSSSSDNKEDNQTVDSNERPREFPESLTIKATEKLTSVFNSLLDVLSPRDFDDSDEEVILGDGHDKVTISRERWNILLSAVQTDPQTYCHEPEGPPDDHETWLERFSLIDHEHRVQNLLNTVPEINKFYEKLVPKELTHDMFWNRYFYRVEQLKDLEVKRALAIRDHELKEVSPEVTSPIVTEPQTETVDLTVLAEKSNEADKQPQTPSPVSSEASVSGKSHKSRGSSEDWEKADLTDIVDEAAKRLGDKLNAMAPPETTRSDDSEDWEFE